jgi:general secretion pathway protein B
MSFILDALKKAEAERNRRVAPVLMDARIAPPRRGLPGWAWALGVVLLVNLGVLTWLVLRSPAPQPAAEQAAPTAAAASTTAPVGTQPAAGAAPTTVLPPPLPGAPDAPAASAPQEPPAPAAISTPSEAEDLEQLPSAEQLRAAGVPLPELQLNLHIYDLAPAQRSILLNGVRLREGEYTPDGVKVERITPQAVVLEASGRRFRIATGG